MIKKFEISVPYWDKQICYGSGTAYTTIEAETAEEALQLVRDGINNGDVLFDFNERTCEVDSIEELEYEWDKVKVDEDI